MLCAKSNLACVYYEQKMYKEAAVLTEEVQKTAVLVLGPDHPSTVRYGRNLKVIRAACVDQQYYFSQANVTTDFKVTTSNK